MSYISKIIASVRSTKSSPAKHTTKNNGKPVGAGHLKRHEKGTAHKSVGEIIGTGVNAVKDAAKVVDEKVIKPAVESVKETVEDAKKVIKNPPPAKFTKEGLSKMPNDIPGKFGETVRGAKKKEGLLQKRGKKKGKGLKSSCWKGYEAIGMKKKGGRKVPNCVPKKK